MIATFCYNISRDIPIEVHNPNARLTLVYIDDVIHELISALEYHSDSAEVYRTVEPNYQSTLEHIVQLLSSFKESRENKFVPDMFDEFTKKLYSTYLSFLPHDKFSYPLKMNIDHRGSFTEFLKTPDRGQVSINVSLPGVVKGNHWHHTKNEKFLVVSGSGIIRFRNISDDTIIEYHVDGDNLEVLDIPTGYTHNIENTGKTKMVTVMWANEQFDPENPDTFFLEV